MNDKPIYESMTVVEIVDDIVGLIRECPMIGGYILRLEGIRSSVGFLELPDSRLGWLCKIGRVLNEAHEKCEPLRRESYWGEIHSRMKPELERGCRAKEPSSMDVGIGLQRYLVVGPKSGFVAKTKKLFPEIQIQRVP